jgi:hypothetical protein
MILSSKLIVIVIDSVVLGADRFRKVMEEWFTVINHNWLSFVRRSEATNIMKNLFSFVDIYFSIR